MSDLNFQNFSTVQSDKQSSTSGVAVAAVMAPTNFLTRVVGSSATLTTITPPVTGVHMLCFIFSIGALMGVTGNIANVITPTAGVPVLFIYDPLTAKYYALT